MMSTGVGGGGSGGKEFFLSAHRCPEVDLLPHHDSENQLPPLNSFVPSKKSFQFTCTGESESNYLDVSFTSRSEEEEEEEGSISDWSEEDLSLHFSPSVIHPSDDEESTLDSCFECVDITMETQVKGQEEEGLKMVPKRQIQLKKKKKTDNITDQEKLQVTLKDGPAEGGGANMEVSDNELTVCPRPDLLHRQHSMPASLHTRSTTSSDPDSSRVYKGLVAGAAQGFPVGRNSRQRLQKSLSLDETKTKMASCIIKSVLSKKMQVEQNSKTLYLQKKPEVLPGPPQQRVREGDRGETSCLGGKTGGGAFKAPVHVVRDMRSLVKSTYSLSFSTASTAPSENSKTASFKVTGMEESPPPTYHQAMGIKGYLTKVAASLSQSQDRKHNDTLSRPITQQRRGSEPIISRSKVDDVTWPVSSDLLERAKGVRHQAEAPLPPSAFIQHPSQPPSSHLHPQAPQPLLPAQEKSSILGVSSQFATSSSHRFLHPCVYTPTSLPSFPHNLHPHLGKVSHVHSPMSYNQTKLPAPPPAPILHLLRSPEENQSRLTSDTLDQPECFTKTCPPRRTSIGEDQDIEGNTLMPAVQEQRKHQTLQQNLQQPHQQNRQQNLQQPHQQNRQQNLQQPHQQNRQQNLQQPHQQNRQQNLQQPHQQNRQQQLLCCVQDFLPAQMGSDFLVGITGSGRGPDPRHVVLDPKSGQYFYVDTPPPPQRKMLLDPETGQYVQVFLPAASFTPKVTMFSVRCANPTPIMINPVSTVLSVMQIQPTVSMSSLCAPSCLPLTLHRPSVNITHTAP